MNLLDALTDWLRGVCFVVMLFVLAVIGWVVLLLVLAVCIALGIIGTGVAFVALVLVAVFYWIPCLIKFHCMEAVSIYQKK